MMNYVVIETNLNGEDDYWSTITIISEEEYILNQGKSIFESELKTLRCIDKFDYRKEFGIGNGKHKISIRKIFTFE